MNDANRDMAAKKIEKMSTEQILKLLIFMSGMETQQKIEETNCQQDTQAG